jgi:GTP-binding protein
MQIKSAEFVTSNTDVNKCPDTKILEYAFIGRSNVGKSSLINMLCNKKALAKVSGTPGKTQLINHFLINNSWHLVDLPGYGFAKIPKAESKKLEKIIWDYIIKREQLTAVFVLIDSRLEPQKIDLDFFGKLGLHNIPFLIIFTKADKLSSSAINKNITAYKKKMLLEWEDLPRTFLTSSLTNFGKDELLGYIETLNKELAKQ